MVEMIIAMAIGLVLMGGIYSNFMLQTKVQNFQSSFTDVTQDLTLVGQVMFKELKSAQRGTITFGQNPPPAWVLMYTDKDGNVGSFEYQQGAGALTSSFQGADVLCWRSPTTTVSPPVGACDEVMRELSINALDPTDATVMLPMGFDAYSYVLPPDGLGTPLPSDVYGVWVVTLKGMYRTSDKKTGLVTHTFKVWQRN